MGSNIYLQKICEQCGKEFTARTTVTRFCSHTCSSRAYKDRTRKDKVEKIKTDTIRIKTKEIREIQARDVLTVSEVAALVGCSRRTAYRLAATGTIKSANLGQRLTRIRRWIRSCRSRQNPPRKRKSTKFQNATPSAKPCEHSVYRTRLSVTS